MRDNYAALASIIEQLVSDRYRLFSYVDALVPIRPGFKTGYPAGLWDRGNREVPGALVNQECSISARKFVSLIGHSLITSLSL